MRALVIGYPGVGKTTLCMKTSGCIDLESSLFHGVMCDEDCWIYTYCNVAEDLAEQDNIVFISSHADVQDFLASRISEIHVPIIACFPDKSLQEAWIHKLTLRYGECPTAKNCKALVHVMRNYSEDVEVLNKWTNKVVIDSLEYDLESLIKFKLAEITGDKK